MLEEPTAWLQGLPVLPRISAEKLIIKEMLRLGATEEETRAGMAEMNLLDNLYGYEKMPHNSGIIAENNININVDVNNNIETNALNVVVKNNTDEMMENSKSIISKINSNDKSTFDVPASAGNVLIVDVTSGVNNLSILEVPASADNRLVLNESVKTSYPIVLTNRKKVKRFYEEIQKTLVFMFLLFLFMGVITFKIYKVIVKMINDIFLKVYKFYRWCIKKMQEQNKNTVNNK